MAKQAESEFLIHGFVEFRFDANGPVELRDLAGSFAALDAIYDRTGNDKNRLAVVELRSGSIIATIAPILPFMGDIVPAVDAALKLTEFSKRLKDAFDAFSGKISPNETIEDAGLAPEIRELVKPLTGRNGASLSFVQFSARSKSKERTIEIEATYSSSDIDRLYVNAERSMEAAAAIVALPLPSDDSEPSLVKNVELILHQANFGPAKERGQTGDKGVIASVSEKPLPLYFASSISNLKERLVKAKKNPFLERLIVDAWVIRDNGFPKSYTVIEVHGGDLSKLSGAPMLTHKPSSS